MKLNEMEQEMKEKEKEEKEKKEEGEKKMVHLLPEHVPSFFGGVGWRRDEHGVWVRDLNGKDYEPVSAVSPHQESNVTVHFPHRLNRDTYGGREEDIAPFEVEAGGSKMVVVVDEMGRAKYANQNPDGHLGAVEDDWPFWNTGGRSPFD